MTILLHLKIQYNSYTLDDCSERSFLISLRKYKLCVLTNLLKIEYTLPHYILEEYICNFRYVRLYDVDIPKNKWLNYLQTVETLIRCHVYTVSALFASYPLWVSSLQLVRSASNKYPQYMLSMKNQN